MKTINLIPPLMCFAALASHSSSIAETLQERCNNYAKTAVSQNQANINAKCNYTGLRWSNDAAGQAKWCMSVLPKISSAENRLRQHFLKTCLAKKADVTISSNNESSRMPGACRYNNEQYQLVNYMFNRNLDNSGPEPIALLPNGLIDYDFNRDGKKDYMFLERSPKHKFRAVFCASSPQGWQRQVLSTFRENIGAGPAVNTDQISFHQGKISIGRTDTQHNWGTTSTYAEYSYSMEHKSLLLDKKILQFTSAAIGVASTDLIRDYEKGEVRMTASCGHRDRETDPPCDDAKDNVVTKMKPSEHTLAVRKKLKIQ